ncbi:MAG: hypothetical protein VB055_09005 [Oscillospiraceae bacterium]|nr:hypothetical protein [Oscillospiraceae bacterium]
MRKKRILAILHAMMLLAAMAMGIPICGVERIATRVAPVVGSVRILPASGSGLLAFRRVHLPYLKGPPFAGQAPAYRQRI